MKLGFLSILILMCISSCGFANDNNTFKIKNWEIKENTELSDLGINAIHIDNPNDQSNIVIVEKNGKTSAVSSLIGGNNRIGIQYEDNSSEIKYIKVSPWYKSGVLDSSYVKLFKNKKGNWVLIEYADRSEKKILRQAELK